MLRRYRELLSAGVLKHDKYQLETVKKFDTLQKSIQHKTVISKNIFNVFHKYFSKTNINIDQISHAKSMYVYGGVGTGKTMLMDLFIETSLLKNRCIRSHWNSFLLALHHEIHSIKMAPKSLTQSNSYIMDIISQKLLNKASVLCLDEVQKADPASAVLLTSLFEILLSKGFIIICTSNRCPTDLLLNQSFDQNLFGCKENKTTLCSLISDQFFIYRVKSKTDHRNDNLLSIDEDLSLEKFKGIKTYHIIDAMEITKDHPITSIVKKPHQNYSTKILIVNSGRKLTLNSSYENNSGTFKNVLLLDSNDLLNSNMCPADYIAICSFYQAVYIDRLPVLYPYICGDAVRRFINFLDTAYDCRTKIFISSKVDLKNLICMKSNMNNACVENCLNDSKNDEAFAIERAISRLNEMQTTKYLSLQHTPCRFDIFDNNEINDVNSNKSNYSKESLWKSFTQYIQNE